MPSAIQTITFIIGSIVVIFGAYYATYWLARGSQKINQGRAIQVLDRFSLAKDKSIVVLYIYDRIYLVAFSAGSVTVIDSLNAEDIPLPDLERAMGMSPEANISSTAFGELLKKMPWAKNSANIPFEKYLQQEQMAKEKKAQYSAFSDTEYQEEDIRR